MGSEHRMLVSRGGLWLEDGMLALPLRAAVASATQRWLHEAAASTHHCITLPSRPAQLAASRELDAAWFRRRVGVVSQDPRLFGLTVAENIAYGCPDATQVCAAKGQAMQ